MKILYSARFLKRYKKLPPSIKSAAERRESIFLDDWEAGVLSTHKLKGKFRGLWAFSINSKYRIIFEFVDDGTVLFSTVGDHGVYD